MLEIQAGSLTQVQALVSARIDGVYVDLSGDTVQLAFVDVDATPGPSDWKTGSWDTDTTTTPPTYRAQCLVGPGGAVELTPGDWNMHVKVTHSPEIPVIESGLLRVV